MSGLKVLVLGAGGMLGHKLVQRLPEMGIDTWAGVRLDRGLLSHFGIASEDRIISGIDAANADSIRDAVSSVMPDAVINAIGVIKQKEEARHAANTIEINAVFPHRLFAICRERGTRLVHISTDCVFSGTKGCYREEDPADAQDLYGRSKALGEVVSEGAVTIRTSIVGRELRSSHGLLEWFLSNAGGSVKGFAKAYFSGFTTDALARIIGETILARPELEGLYHVAATRISKYKLLKLIDQELELGTTIQCAEEPAIDRSLDAGKFERETGFSPPTWNEMIEGLAEESSIYTEWRKTTT